MLLRGVSSRNVVLVLLGVSGLLLKHWFSDSLNEIVYSYLGNVSVSFAIYFLASIGFQNKGNRVAYIVLALLAVESFELLDGFGIMTNVFDPYDLVANAIGVGLAFVVDIVLDRILSSPPKLLDTS
jgi:hypothetical protein